MANTKVVGSNTPKKKIFPISYGDFNHRTLFTDAFSVYLDDWSIPQKRSRCYETGSWIIPYLLVSSELFTGARVCGKNKLSFFTGLLEFY